MKYSKELHDDLRFNVRSVSHWWVSNNEVDEMFTCLLDEIERLNEIIKRLKQDGERMADFFIEGERGNSEVFVCIYCDAPPKFQNRKLEHEEYCPVSKHDALMKELE